MSHASNYLTGRVHHRPRRGDNDGVGSCDDLDAVEGFSRGKRGCDGCIRELDIPPELPRLQR